jgi:N-methylhydantoinase A
MREKMKPAHKLRGEGSMPQSDDDIRIGIDIGGTFTDFVLVDECTGALALEKTLSTPTDLWQGIHAGIAKLGVDLVKVNLVVHGTTVGLNAFLERKGRRTGLITTWGFRDVYEIGRHNRIDMYDLFYLKPQALVSREFRLEVHERLDGQGQILTPLSEEDVATCARTFKAAGIDSIAVCFLHAYANPVHELQAGEIINQVYPEATVSLSHQLVREWREYERTSTTVINAYIAPVVAEYLARVEQGLAEQGYHRPFFINKSSGGIMPAAAARAAPIYSIMSGPAGGAISAAHVGKLEGFENVISFDMGGTSTDVALTYEGITRVTSEAKVDGHPMLVPMIDIHSIGAGGGSIAWIGETGALNVGPHSAGADPGPACYGRGGQAATVTDANLVLGRLDPAYFLGGEMSLDTDAAQDVVAKQVAQPLGLGTVEAASGIIRIINAKMGHAIRALTIERGLDPREFVLLSFGGAGAMHACALAEELSIPRILIPMATGQFSALGMLLSDIRHDLVRVSLDLATDLDAGTVEGRYQELIAEARQMLIDDGVDRSQMAFQRMLDMRYVGQEYTVTVPVPATLSDDWLPSVRAEFDRRHERTYGHASVEEPVEVVSLRLTAFGRMPELKPQLLPDGGPIPPAEAKRTSLPVFFTGRAGRIDKQDQNFVDCPVYDRDALLAGNVIVGPALVLETGATAVLNPGLQLTVTPLGSLLITREEEIA